MLPNSSRLLKLLAILGLLSLPASLRGQETRELGMDLGQLAPDTIRFALLQQDNPIGEIVVSLTRAGSAWTMTERTETPFGHQVTTVTFQEGPTMLSVEQQGEMAGTRIATNLTYERGSVSGLAIVPTPAGIDTVDVNAAVPPGTIDDNALVALFPAMRLEPRKSFSLPVFSAGQNALATYELKVERGEPVQWEGGPVATLRIEAVGGPAPVTFVVTESRPHLLLQIAPPGPLRIERLQE